MSNILMKMRQRYTWMMVAGLALISLLVGAFTDYGIEPTTEGVLSLVPMGIVSLLSAVLVDLVDSKRGINSGELIKKLWPVAFTVLLAVSLVSPLSDWLVAYIGL